MGGSSKPEPVKATPFVEPPAQRNPIPNFFQQGNPMMGGGGAARPRFQMNPAASQGAMRMPMQQQAQQVMTPEIQALLALLAKQGRI